MSYCGACGTFYYLDCPRRPDGVCFPASNPHDERVARLTALSVAVAAEVAGMVAENQWRERRGESVAYREVQFFALAVNLRKESGE